MTSRAAFLLLIDDLDDNLVLTAHALQQWHYSIGSCQKIFLLL